MIDEREILKHNAEMAVHANGAAQFMSSLIGGQYVTKEQAREAMDFLLASTKPNIESYPNATQQEKDIVKLVFQLRLLLVLKKQSNVIMP